MLAFCEFSSGPDITACFFCEFFRTNNSGPLRCQTQGHQMFDCLALTLCIAWCYSFFFGTTGPSFRRLVLVHSCCFLAQVLQFLRRPRLGYQQRRRKPMYLLLVSSHSDQILFYYYYMYLLCNIMNVLYTSYYYQGSIHSNIIKHKSNTHTQGCTLHLHRRVTDKHLCMQIKFFF